VNSLAFALAATAGLVAGMAFDLFVLCGLAAPLFVVASYACAKAGIFAGLATAAELAGVLQMGYMAGLMTRACRSTRKRSGVAP
jgi:hypothetical protein